MYQSINKSEFHSAFHRMDRGTQFSYEGLNILFNALEEYENNSDQKIELDVISLCCDYSELTAEEIQRQYDVDHDVDNESSLEEQVEDFLACNTWVLGSHENNGIKYYIFQQF